MTDDWTWFFSSANARDRILRDEVESLGSALSSANSTSYRLSSQLATLSGSIETRLNALSAAFDAYVELGDVREQLAAFPDTSAVRRAVVAAIAALSAGRDAEPVDPRDLDYWLPYALNAVVAIAAGHPDAELERRAAALDADAEWFMVSLSGALGHGAAVADRVPALLVCDGTLTPRQVALWTAAYEGAYGPVLDRIGAGWGPTLAAGAGGVNQTEWTSWVRNAAGGGGSTGLTWLRGQTGAEAAPVDPAAGKASAHGGDGSDLDRARDGLRLLIMKLVEQGYGGEAELLERGRRLRQRIEDPAAARAAEQAETAEPELNVALLDQVRAAFLATEPGTDQHGILIGWLRPGLEAAVQGLRHDVAAATTDTMQVRGGGRSVTITASGPDATQLAAAEYSIAAANDVPFRGQLIGMIVGGVLAVFALVLAVTGRGVAGFLVLVLAGVAGAYAFLQYRARSAGSAVVADQRAELRAEVEQTRARVAESETKLLAVKQESGVIAEDVLRQLAGHADPDRDRAASGRGLS